MAGSIALPQGYVLDPPQNNSTALPAGYQLDAAPASDPSQGGSTLQVGPLDTGIPLSQGMTRFLAGAGKGMTDLGRGAGQAVGLVDQQSIKDAQQLDAPLMATGAGKAGAITGTIAAAAPAMLIPGANTYTGAALTGAVLGAAQPVAEGDVLTGKAKNAAVGGALGVAGQAVGDTLGIATTKYANWREAKAAALQAKNAVRDATVQAAQDAGLVVQPSMAGGNTAGRLLEGLSGKAKTEQLMSVRNQTRLGEMARNDLGLPADAPLTAETMQAVRNAAYTAGYEPVKQIGQIATDGKFTQALDNIAANTKGAANSFPDAVKNDIPDLIDSLKVPSFDAGDALKMTQILRDNANTAYRAGQNELGAANKSAATAIENQIERSLSAAGKDGHALLTGFQEARTLMAKAHTVEDALVEGGGMIKASKLAARVQAGKPLTGELRTAANLANINSKVMQVPQGGFENPLTVLDFFSGGLGAGGAAASGGLGAVPLAFPAARVAARYGITSGAGQRLFATPNYSAGVSQPLLQAIGKNPEITNMLLRSGLVGAAQQQ